MKASYGGDFARNSRLVRLSAFAAVIGVVSTLGAIVLQNAIRFFTNIFFFHTFSLTQSSPADNHLGVAVILVPALFPLQTYAPSSVAMFSCCVAGLASGGVSALITLLLYRVEDFFGRLPLHWMWWPALGGLVLGAGGLIEPRALGGFRNFRRHIGAATDDRRRLGIDHRDLAAWWQSAIVGTGMYGRHSVRNDARPADRRSVRL